MAAGRVVRLNPAAPARAPFAECPMCGSEKLEYLFVVDRTPVCRCIYCSLMFLNPQPSPTPGAPTDEAVSETLVDAADAKAIFHNLSRYANGPIRRVLLINCSDASVEHEARTRNFECVHLTAQEMSEGALAHLPSAAFDACVLYACLGRVPEPGDVLAEARRILVPDGSLALTVAAVDSRAARLLRQRWWEFSRHNFFYFSVNTLQNLLAKRGFVDPITFWEHGSAAPRQLRNHSTRFRRGALPRIVGRVGRSLPPTVSNRLLSPLAGRITFLCRPGPERRREMLSIIVPVYNERATFAEMMERVLAKELPNVDREIIIVESNSTDGSREEVLKYAHAPGVKIVLEDRPMGKGHAVRTGLRHASGTVVLFQDADLEYDVNDYDVLLAPIIAFAQPFVIGSRHNAAGDTWKIRNFSDAPLLSQFFNLGHFFFLALFNAVYRQSLSDPFSMYKVFRRDCLYGLEFECNRFDFDHEIVIKLLRKAYRPVEIPVNYESRSIREGKKVTMFRDPLTWIRAIAKFRVSPLYGKAYRA